MRDVVRTNDPIAVSYIVALLRDAGIHHHVADLNMSVMEGSIGVFPRRIMVLDEDVQAVRNLLRGAGLGHELLPDER